MKPTFRTSLATLALCVATGAQASTYIVTKTTDSMDGLCDSDCSLREAVQAANLHPGSDTIKLPAGHYMLTIPGLPNRVEEDDNAIGDLDVYGQLNIVGAGVGTTIIDEINEPNASVDRVFDIHEGATFKSYALTITASGAYTFANPNGEGIRNAGIASLRNTRIAGKRPGLYANSFDGVVNLGTLTLEDVQIDLADGGGITNSRTLHMRRSSVTDGNHAIINTGSAFIDQSALLGNSDSFRKYPDDTSIVGTAIYNVGILELSNSTISRNHTRAVGEYGYYFGYDNGSGGGHSAIYNAGHGKATLSFVTIVNNIGGGLENYGSVALSGALIAGNLGIEVFQTTDEFCNEEFGCAPGEKESNHRDPSPYDGYNCNGIDLSGYDPVAYNYRYTVRNSIIGRDGSCTGQIDVDNGRVFTTLLEPLRLGGGVTATHKPLRGSVAIDAINPFAEVGADACPATDQRGAPRPPNDDGRRGGYCDIGAYELRQ